MASVRFSTAYEHPDTLQVISAKLWLLLRFKSVYLTFLKDIFSHSRVTIEVFAVGNGSSVYGLSQTGLSVRKLATVRVPLQRAGWMSVELPNSAVQKWFDGPVGQKFDLFIHCVDCGAFVEPLVITQQPTDTITNDTLPNAKSKNIGDNRPFLVIQTKVKPMSPQKRTKRSTDCHDGSDHCCRMPLYVNFTDIGWDKWIVAPRGYHAYHCIGSCDVAFDPERNFHSQILEAHRLRNPYSRVQPCCFPKRFSPMQLIYMDPDSNIVDAVLPNMVVEECGCA